MVFPYYQDSSNWVYAMQQIYGQKETEAVIKLRAHHHLLPLL